MQQNPLRLFVYGMTGKMGREIESYAASLSSPIQVTGTSPSRPLSLTPGAVALDFSTTASFQDHLKEVCQARCPFVIGTTGLSENDEKMIQEAAQHIPILHASNTSIGVAVLTQLVQAAAKMLDDSYDIEIFETHHRHKVDAPSGTALSLGKAAMQGRQKPHSAPSTFDRQGPRQPGSLGYAVHRGGGVTGDHTVRFIGDEEIIELSHRSLSRRLFARGAVQAAQWLINQPPGLYGMHHIFR